MNAAQGEDVGGLGGGLVIVSSQPLQPAAVTGQPQAGQSAQEAKQPGRDARGELLGQGVDLRGDGDAHGNGLALAGLPFSGVAQRSGEMSPGPGGQGIAHHQTHVGEAEAHGMGVGPVFLPRTVQLGFPAIEVEVVEGAEEGRGKAITEVGFRAEVGVLGRGHPVVVGAERVGIVKVELDVAGKFQPKVAESLADAQLMAM